MRGLQRDMFMTKLLLATNRFFFGFFEKRNRRTRLLDAVSNFGALCGKPTKQKQIGFFCRWPGLGWVSVGLASVITSLHLFNMTLLLSDLNYVIDEILQVFFACYEGILLWRFFVSGCTSVSLSHTC